MKIREFNTLDQCSRVLADTVSARLAQAVRERHRATLVLGGGSTPRMLHRYLADAAGLSKDLWEKIHLFWGDERCVPLDHPDSNFRMAYETLLQHVPVPEANIHPPPTHLPAPEPAAIAYEKMIRAFFAGDVSARKPPRFDVVLLGMGGDGHTASLFPGHDPAPEGRWVTAVHSSQATPPVPRITMTLPLFNRARHVFFLAGGSEKIRLIQQIMRACQEGACRYPAGCVHPAGELVWFVAKKTTMKR